MGFAPTSIPPRGSRDLRHEGYVLIEPEKQDRQKWTKVSIDTFVQ